MRVDPAPAREPARAVDPDVESIPWLIAGLRAGVLGAVVIALFFAVLDFATGRLFWTPFALGSALFRSAAPASGAAVDPVLVLAYTAVHGLVFVGFGSTAAFYLLTGSRTLGPVATRLAVAGVLFAALEVVFVLFAKLFAPGSLAVLGAGRVALANALAAVAMAGLLCASASRDPGVERR